MVASYALIGIQRPYLAILSRGSMNPCQHISTVALPRLGLVPGVILLDCNYLIVCIIVLHLVWFLLAHLLVLVLHILVQLMCMLMLLVQVRMCISCVV